MAEDMVATNGHHPVVSTRSTSTWRAADAYLLDDAHVDDADAAIGAARVVDLAQRVDDALGVLGHGRLPGSMTRRKPVVGVARAGSAVCSARRARPMRGRGSSRRGPRATRRPRSVGDPLPDVAGELLGPARARAGGVGGDRRRPPPAGLHARAAVGLEGLAPRPRPPVRAARGGLPLVAGRQAPAGPRAVRLRVLVGHVGCRMIGELRIGELARERRRHLAPRRLRRTPPLDALTTGQRPMRAPPSPASRSAPASPSRYVPAASSTVASSIGLVLAGCS